MVDSYMARKNSIKVTNRNKKLLSSSFQIHQTNITLIFQLPAEQLLPPELYATPPPPSLYSNPNRNPLNLTQMPELEPRYHLEPRSLAMDSRSCSNSPPVRFNPENNSVYYSKSVLDRTTNTLPHLKPTRKNGKFFSNAFLQNLNLKQQFPG